MDVERAVSYVCKFEDLATRSDSIQQREFQFPQDLSNSWQEVDRELEDRSVATLRIVRNVYPEASPLEAARGKPTECWGEARRPLHM
jgi:hypothetical protein